MIAAATTVCIWGLAALVLLVMLISLNLKLSVYLISMNMAARAHAKKIKKRTQDKYNKILEMTPTELDDYLSRIFSLQLDIASAVRISENDPDAPGKMYGEALAAVLIYLGEETVSCLDYYYGKDYVVKWCELRYRYLENKGILTRLINKDIDPLAVKNEISK